MNVCRKAAKVSSSVVVSDEVEMVNDGILVPNVALCASNQKGELANMSG